MRTLRWTSVQRSEPGHDRRSTLLCTLVRRTPRPHGAQQHALSMPALSCDPLGTRLPHTSVAVTSARAPPSPVSAVCMPDASWRWRPTLGSGSWCRELPLCWPRAQGRRAAARRPDSTPAQRAARSAQHPAKSTAYCRTQAQSLPHAELEKQQHTPERRAPASRRRSALTLTPSRLRIRRCTCASLQAQRYAYPVTSYSALSAHMTPALPSLCLSDAKRRGVPLVPRRCCVALIYRAPSWSGCGRR